MESRLFGVGLGGVFVRQALPEALPVLIVVVVGSLLDMFELFDLRGFVRVKTPEVSPPGSFAWRDEAPGGISHHVPAQRGKKRIVFLELSAGMDVVVIVVHGPVGVVPGLETFRPVFEMVSRCVAFLLTAKDDDYLVVTGNPDL